MLSLCLPMAFWRIVSFFFFNDTATTEIYTLSLHDALPISPPVFSAGGAATSWRSTFASWAESLRPGLDFADRKSTRLNSSHLVISYAVFCLKKKKKGKLDPTTVDTQKSICTSPRATTQPRL